MRKMVVICVPTGINQSTVINYLTGVLPKLRHVKFYTNNMHEDENFYVTEDAKDLFDRIQNKEFCAQTMNMGFLYSLRTNDIEACYEQDFVPLVVTCVAPLHVASVCENAIKIGLAPEKTEVLRDFLCCQSHLSLMNAYQTEATAFQIAQQCRELDKFVEYDLGIGNKHCYELENIIFEYLVPKVD